MASLLADLPLPSPPTPLDSFHWSTSLPIFPRLLRLGEGLAAARRCTLPGVCARVSVFRAVWCACVCRLRRRVCACARSCARRSTRECVCARARGECAAATRCTAATSTTTTTGTSVPPRPLRERVYPYSRRSRVSTLTGCALRSGGERRDPDTPRGCQVPGVARREEVQRCLKGNADPPRATALSGAGALAA